jgi:hypothetical protein
VKAHGVLTVQRCSGPGTGLLLKGVIFRSREEALVYIDPNTGGMLFQILAVLFGAISGIVLIFSSRIKMFFAKLRRRMRESDRETFEDDQA